MFYNICSDAYNTIICIGVYSVFSMHQCVYCNVGAPMHTLFDIGTSKYNIKNQRCILFIVSASEHIFYYTWMDAYKMHKVRWCIIDIRNTLVHISCKENRCVYVLKKTSVHTLCKRALMGKILCYLSSRKCKRYTN